MLFFAKRIVTGALIWIFSGAVFAQVPVIKLSCSAMLTKRNASGVLVGTSAKTILLDVAQTDAALIIMSTDDDIRSVASEKAPHIADVTNYSNETRWHLINRSNDEKPTVTKMLIDRNSGQLLYTSDFNGGQLFTEVTGTCSKLDMQKKKF
jgi:hypothetical protein